MEELDFSEEKLYRVWREVKEDFWGDLKGETLRVLKRLLQGCLEEEMGVAIAAKRHERSPSRRDYRNGHYERDLETELGLLTGVRVPRCRRGPFQSRILARYQRRQLGVNRSVRELFLAGVSTRRLGALLKPIFGRELSPETVSRIGKELDREVRRFWARRLSDDYLYLVLDGITLKVKGPLGVKKRLVLCAYGITLEGRKELISFRLVAAESEASWEAFLDDLYRRGLEGKALRLVVTDGSLGLHQALDRVYPFVARQLCWVHKLRNVANKLPRKFQAECLAGARAIYQAENQREAVARFRQWALRWRGVAPRAVACLERDLQELLSFLECPEAHRRMVRTTNAIERAFREIRRRTRPMSSFTNPASCNRIIYGIFCYLNNQWKKRPSKNLGQEFTQIC